MSSPLTADQWNLAKDLFPILEEMYPEYVPEYEETA